MVDGGTQVDGRELLSCVWHERELVIVVAQVVASEEWRGERRGQECTLNHR